jgi:cell shape-determining protein MreC
MAASAICLLIPARITHPTKNPLQLLAALQWAVHDTAARTEESVRSHIRPAVPGEEFDRVDREREALQNRLVAMDARVVELQEALAAVSAWRGRGLSSSVDLILARVVSDDAVAYRESLKIDRGTSDGVEAGDWVVSHGFLPSAAGGQVAGAESLSNECLLGEVLDTTPLTSRVILLSDPARRPPARVRVVRVEAGRVTGPQEDFVLYGAGQGRMTVSDVRASLCEAGRVRVGDLIVSSPGEPKLPISMVIGEIDRIDRDARNPLLYRLSIKPRLDTRSIRQVYVVDTSARDK